jgi:Ribonuclease G/E
MRRELVISAGPGEWRAALVEDGTPVELRVERGDGVEAGSIHLGRAVRLLPALGAVLVDLGGDRPAFLPQSEIHPRGRHIDEGERVIVQIRREAQGGKAAQLTTAVTLPGDTAAGAAHLEPPRRLFPAQTSAAALAGVFPVIEQILIDEPGAIPEIRAAFPDTAVAHLAETEWAFELDALFEQALATTAALPGGGSVHFEATRAAVLIDVDTGTPETGSPGRTALAVNVAAAEAIARQIRLRNLSGGIVIDFVGLDDRGARERVRAALARGLEADPLQPQILGWTRLGHLELVRRRRTRPLADGMLEPALNGTLVKTAVTIAHEILRAVRRAARAQPGGSWRVIVAPAVAAALTGEAAAAVQQLEQRLGRSIAIAADVSLGRDRFQIEPF